MKKWIKIELVRRYGCCWETIDWRFNPEKYKKEKKIRIYTSKLDPYKNIIDTKLGQDNVPATGIFNLLTLKYGYNGKYGFVFLEYKYKIINNKFHVLLKKGNNKRIKKKLEYLYKNWKYKYVTKKIKKYYFYVKRLGILNLDIKK